MTAIRQVNVKENLLKSNDFLAARLREQWAAQKTFVVNLLSSPGSGKTTWLERTLPALGEKYRVLVLEGDIETAHDAERLHAVGVEAFQITTGGACHLEAHMIEQAWQLVDATEPYDFVFIENVGNLVCPASFDLGEHLRVVMLSVTEGEDKPTKYPKAFHTADALMLTKCDIVEHFDFRPEEAERLARDLRPDIVSIRSSARTGEGEDAWVELLESRRAAMLATPSESEEAGRA